MKTSARFFVILIFISLLALVQVNCLSTAQYDIRGTWSTVLSFYDGTSDVLNFTFTGTMDAGAVTHTGVSYPGTYTVSGSRVEFELEYIIIGTRSTESYNGTMRSDTTMDGDFEWDTDIIVATAPPLVWAWGSFTATKM